MWGFYMQFARVLIDPNKSRPKLEIIIGKRQLGEYRIFQFVPGPPRRAKVVGSGDNVVQDSQDVFNLDAPSDLAGVDIVSAVVIYKQTADPGDLYAVTAVLSQDGDPVMAADANGPGGVLTVTGKLEKTTAIALQYKLELGV